MLVACHRADEHKTVICIPVYGQSLALGEEAERITDFDSLAEYAGGRIVTENMDHRFGYFENDDLKKFAKKIVGYQKRAYELSIYSMAKMLADQTGSDTLVCIFPGGQGATALANLSKGAMPYQEFMEDIETAYNEALSRGQQAIGRLAARSALGIIRNDTRFHGLIPQRCTAEGNDIVVQFDIPTPPLVLDTTQVRKADNYGFSVINQQHRNIATTTTLENKSIRIHCTEPPQNCKVRYVVNGDYMKSGNQHGPRGNLRDAAHNWCYQFDMQTE